MILSVTTLLRRSSHLIPFKIPSDISALNGVSEVSEWQHESNRTPEYDLGRIAYFVNDPTRITPLAIDSKGELRDGRHRLIAAWLLNIHTLPGEFT